MKSKVIWILIGFVISGVILHPLVKKRRAEEKAQEEELMKKVDDMMMEALDEELRHKLAMEDIEKKGEQELKDLEENHERDMKELVERVERKLWEYNATVGTGGIHYMMKYRDVNGVIHEFDAANSEQFRRIMNEKTNRLIFE